MRPEQWGFGFGLGEKGLFGSLTWSLPRCPQGPPPREPSRKGRGPATSSLMARKAWPQAGGRAGQVTCQWGRLPGELGCP